MMILFAPVIFVGASLGALSSDDSLESLRQWCRSAGIPTAMRAEWRHRTTLSDGSVSAEAPFIQRCVIRWPDCMVRMQDVETRKSVPEGGRSQEVVYLTPSHDWVATFPGRGEFSKRPQAESIKDIAHTRIMEVPWLSYLIILESDRPLTSRETSGSIEVEDSELGYRMRFRRDGERFDFTGFDLGTDREHPEFRVEFEAFEPVPNQPPLRMPHRRTLFVPSESGKEMVSGGVASLVSFEVLKSANDSIFEPDLSNLLNINRSSGEIRNTNNDLVGMTTPRRTITPLMRWSWGLGATLGAVLVAWLLRSCLRKA